MFFKGIASYILYPNNDKSLERASKRNELNNLKNEDVYINVYLLF